MVSNIISNAHQPMMKYMKIADLLPSSNYHHHLDLVYINQHNEHNLDSQLLEESSLRMKFPEEMPISRDLNKNQNYLQYHLKTEFYLPSITNLHIQCSFFPPWELH